MSHLLVNRFLYSVAYLLLLGLPASILGYLVRDELNFSALIIVTLVTLVIGGAFDIWAVRQSKNDAFFIWEYNSKSILGFKIYGVPIEDYVFFLVLTPIFIISVYEGAIKFLTHDLLAQAIIFSVLGLIIGYYTVYKHAIRTKK